MNSAVINAFPSGLNLIVSGLIPLLDPPSGLACSEPFSIVADGETLFIPYRIYRPVPSGETFEALSVSDQTIVACWFTRHHDGLVRERFLRSISVYDNTWIIGYVVALCGEYIIEILRSVWENRGLFDLSNLARWLRDNEPLYVRIRSRIISYWDCYYRSSFPRFEDYIGSRLITFFDNCLTDNKEFGAAT